MSCGPGTPAEVTFVLFLDKTGRMVEARPFGRPGAAAVAAARKALSSWTFRPSQVGSRRVADWLTVKVGVTAGH